MRGRTREEEGSLCHGHHPSDFDDLDKIIAYLGFVPQSWLESEFVVILPLKSDGVYVSHVDG